VTLQDRILRARPRAEKVLVDICRIDRPASTTGVLDRSTMHVTAPGSTEVYGPGVPDASYTGKCLIGQRSARQTTEGGQPLVVREYLVSIPAGAPQTKPGDRLTVLTCALDPTLVNDVLELGNADSASLLVLRVIHVRQRIRSIQTEQGGEAE
jgi:hypothetical protein